MIRNWQIFHSGYTSCILISSEWIPVALQHWVVLDFSHSNRCFVIPHCYFNLQFPNDNWCWVYFHMTIWSVNLLRWVIAQILCPFSIGWLFSSCSVSYINFNISPLSYIYLQVFLPIYGLHFHPLYYVFILIKLNVSGFSWIALLELYLTAYLQTEAVGITFRSMIHF